MRRTAGCLNRVMSLHELRGLIARYADDPALAALDGVLLSAVDQPTPPATSTTGTAFALIAQGAKTLAIGDRVYLGINGSPFELME